MRELRAIGATNALAGRRHTLTGKSRFAAAAAAYEHERRDGRLPATWEVIYAHAWAPQPGAPIREGGFDVTSTPVSTLPIRRRRAARALVGTAEVCSDGPPAPHPCSPGSNPPPHTPPRH